MSVVIVGYGRRGEFWANVVTLRTPLEVTGIIEKSAVGQRRARAAFPQATVGALVHLPARRFSLGIVSSPATSHAEVARALVDQVASLIIEKPVGASRADLAQISRLSVPTWSGYVETRNRDYVRLLGRAKALRTQGASFNLEISRVRHVPDREVQPPMELFPHDLHALAKVGLVHTGPCSEHRVYRLDTKYHLELPGERPTIRLAAAFGPRRVTKVRLQRPDGWTASLHQDGGALNQLREQVALGLIRDAIGDNRQTDLSSELEAVALAHDWLAALAKDEVTE